MRSQRRRSASILVAVLAGVTLGALVFGARRGSRSPDTGARRGPVTPAIMPLNPADLDLGTPGQNTEARLEEALQETFPASDPIATHIE